MRKTIIFLLLSVLITLCGCNNDEMTGSCTYPKKCAESISVQDNREQRYETIIVEEYIAQAPELFGSNVFVCDSLSEIDALIEQLNEKNYEELRLWCNEYGFCNNNFNSLIIYDSVWQAKEKEFGISFDEEIPEHIMDDFYEAFYTEMKSNYANYCYCLTNDENDECGIYPFTNSVCLETFCNEKGILIADKVVFKFQQGYLFTCPIDRYGIIGEYSDIRYLYEMWLACEEINDVSCDEMYLAPLYPSQETIVENTNSHIVKRGHYKLSVYITAFPYWGWFNTNIRGRAIIQNYYKGKLSKSLVKGTIFFGAKVACPEYDTEVYDNIFYSGHIYKVFKSKTYTNTLYRTGYLPTKKTNVTLININISLSSGCGASFLDIEYRY